MAETLGELKSIQCYYKSDCDPDHPEVINEFVYPSWIHRINITTKEETLVSRLFPH